MTPQQLKSLIIIASVVAAVLFIFAAVSLVAYITYRMTFMRRRREYDPYFGLDKPKFAEYSKELSNVIESISAEDFEPVKITARDGTKLAGRYYHRCDGAPIHVICHGYKSSPLRDGSGGGCDSRKMGHNLLLIYQRAHGESEGETISFGILERYDIIDWLNYLTERFGDGAEIILIGTSMGAASVIMAAELELPDTVKCIIADSPYSSPKDVILKSVREMGYPAALVYPFIRLGARMFGEFALESAAPITAIKNAKRPIFIAHGEEDSIVPVEMAHRIAEAAEEAGVDCTLATFPGAEHCMSFIVDYDRYVGIRNEFLKKHVRALADGENTTEDNRLL